MCSWLRRRVGKESTSPRSGSVPVPASASNVLPTWDTCKSISISCFNCHPCHVDSFFQGRWTTTSEEGARVRESSGVFQEIRKFQVICLKKFCPTGHCTGKRQLDISCWILYNSILRVTKWMKTSHLLSTQSTSWPEWTPDFFLVSSWTNVITTKWWFNTHALLFFNNVPYVMQGTHDFND